MLQVPFTVVPALVTGQVAWPVVVSRGQVAFTPVGVAERVAEAEVDEVVEVVVAVAVVVEAVAVVPSEVYDYYFNLFLSFHGKTLTSVAEWASVTNRTHIAARESRSAGASAVSTEPRGASGHRRVAITD